MKKTPEMNPESYPVTEETKDNFAYLVDGLTERGESVHGTRYSLYHASDHQEVMVEYFQDPTRESDQGMKARVIVESSIDEGDQLFVEEKKFTLRTDGIFEVETTQDIESEEERRRRLEVRSDIDRGIRGDLKQEEITKNLDYLLTHAKKIIEADQRDQRGLEMKTATESEAQEIISILEKLKAQTEE